MTQDELKALVAQAALHYVIPGEVVGVGTGSTVNKFIDALAGVKHTIRGAVSSSEASSQRLRAAGIAVFDCNDVGELSVYVDGADEIDANGYMIWKIAEDDTDLYEIVYKYPETLTAGLTPVIDSSWHDALHFRAGAYAATLFGMADEARMLLSVAITEVRQRRLSTENPAGSRPVFIGRRV